MNEEETKVCVHCKLEPREGETHGEWRTDGDAWETVCTMQRVPFERRPALVGVIYNITGES